MTRLARAPRHPTSRFPGAGWSGSIPGQEARNGEDYLKLIAEGHGPALGLDRGGIVTEAPVIVQMIADQAEALAPAHGSAERYKRLEWINFLPSEIHKSLGPLFAPALNDPVHGGGGYCFAMLTRGDRMKFDRSAMPNLAAYKALVAARPRVQPEPNFRGSSYLRLDL